MRLDFAPCPVNGSQLLLFVIGELVGDVRRARPRSVAVADQGLGHGSLRRELNGLNVCVAIVGKLRVRLRRWVIVSLPHRPEGFGAAGPWSICQWNRFLVARVMIGEYHAVHISPCDVELAKLLLEFSSEFHAPFR
jgi:hypothetical protein